MSAVDQLRAKSPDELRQELSGLRREHFNLRVQKAVQQLNKPSELRRVRREIGRALTILREKEMSQFAQTGKALEFARIQGAKKPVSAEAEVSPEVAAAAAAAGAAAPAEQKESRKPKAAKKKAAAGKAADAGEAGSAESGAKPEESEAEAEVTTEKERA